MGRQIKNTNLSIIMQNAPRLANVWINCRRRKPPKYLPILLTFITDNCNLQCKMCGAYEHFSVQGQSQELSTQEWKAVIRSAAGLGTMLLAISGGEPLLRPDLCEIIQYARERQIAVHLCSNATMLDWRNVNQLRESGVNTISISVESTIAEIHDSLRGEGSFKKAIQGIRLLHENAPEIKIGINYLITPENFQNMSEMIPFARGLGVDQVKFAPIHTNLQHKGKRWEKFNYLIFKERDLGDLEVEVRKLMRQAARSEIQTTSTMFLDGVTSLYRKPRRFRCHAGYIACAINPAGMVAPCCDMEGTISVRDKPLEEIYRSDGFQQLRQRVHRCDRPCWDTTNAELSLRMRIPSLWGEMAQTLRDFKFYFGNGNLCV